MTEILLFIIAACLVLLTIKFAGDTLKKLGIVLLVLGVVAALCTLVVLWWVYHRDSLLLVIGLVIARLVFECNWNVAKRSRKYKLWLLVSLPISFACLLVGNYVHSLELVGQLGWFGLLAVIVAAGVATYEDIAYKRDKLKKASLAQPQGS
jgi:hypothetical protein